jgi:hypothetical protein
MPDLFPRDGGCRCGKVRFRLTTDPLMTAACHCRGCQRMSSSAFSVTAIMPPDGFELIAGETVIGGMHGELKHHFCGGCMSWIYTEPGFGVINVRATLLDEPEGFAPFIETVAAEKLSWAVTPARHSFEGFPPESAFGPLMAEYAAPARP